MGPAKGQQQGMGYSRAPVPTKAKKGLELKQKRRKLDFERNSLSALQLFVNLVHIAYQDS